MHRHAMDEDQHQQIMEDLANDFLRIARHSSRPPTRRAAERQRPERDCESNSPAASCSQLDSPLVQSSSGPPAIANPAHKSFKGSSPQSTSSKHGSMRAPFARKFLWTHKSRPESPLAHAPRHRHVCAGCVARAHDGKVLDAAADTSEHGGTCQTSAIPRSQSKPLLETAKPLPHWAQRPVAPMELQQQQVGLASPHPRNIAAGRRRVHLNAIVVSGGVGVQ